MILKGQKRITEYIGKSDDNNIKITVKRDKLIFECEKIKIVVTDSCVELYDNKNAYFPILRSCDDEDKLLMLKLIFWTSPQKLKFLKKIVKLYRQTNLLNIYSCIRMLCYEKYSKLTAYLTKYENYLKYFKLLLKKRIVHHNGKVYILIDDGFPNDLYLAILTRNDAYYTKCASYNLDYKFRDAYIGLLKYYDSFKSHAKTILEYPEYVYERTVEEAYNVATKIPEPYNKHNAIQEFLNAYKAYKILR